ncbi:MAG: hypothetical protein PHC75_08330 [Burkholderiales bacterium]|nr:hypothetical protein [Burkholderiales bacterium]
MKYIDVLIYIILTAISFVFLGKITDHVNPVVTLSIMSSCGIIVFNLLNYKHTKRTYLVIFQSPLLMFIMCVSLAIDWWGMVLGIYLADPVVVMSSLFIAVAILGFVFSAKTINLYAKIISILLLFIADICLAILYKLSIGKSSILGVICGSITGIAYYIYIYSSEQLSLKCGMTSLQLLATRFWLLFLSAMAVVYAKYDYSGLLINDFVKIILVSFGSLIIPIYFAQQSIIKIGGNLTAIFSCLVPPMVYIFYVIVYQQTSVVNTLVCILITISLFLPKIITKKASI